MQVIQQHSRRVRTDIQPANRFTGHPAAGAGSANCDDSTPVVRTKLQPIRKAHTGKRRIEHRFFTSLQIFCSCHNIAVPDTHSLPYPDNVVKAFDILTSQEHPAGGRLFISGERGKKGTIGAAKIWDCSRTVMYVPLDGFWNILQGKRCPYLLKMLAGTLAYFKQIVKIPMYNEPSPIKWTIDAIRQWLEEEDLETDGEEMVKAFERADKLAKKTRRILNDPASLAGWDEGLRGFIPQSDWEYEIKLCCAELRQLYHKYPQRKLEENIHESLFPIDEDGRLYVDDIIGFYFLGKENILNDHVLDYINGSFQECYEEIMPMSIISYDQPGITPVFNLEFEDKLQHLLGTFAYTINNEKDEIADESI
ncbi:hypothetical protein [Chitinophaga arvensicola]|uniref:Uncharacterized protein n=1 Tax=Chitinophaga arvensicola TaxID=29529 RepID=A0A1I0PQ62_9BACT|nr:hypothetical protein [Chitinophaga arvensicola]SEW16433.1 hypothetical protein SAMN04488122_0906 [Chitinophaga arvensicola]